MFFPGQDDLRACRDPRPATAVVPGAGVRQGSRSARGAPITSPEAPVLVGAAVGVPDLDGAPVATLPGRYFEGRAGGGVGRGVRTVAVLARPPVLVGAAVGVPDLHARAVARLAARFVENPPAGDVRQRVGAVAVLARPPLL